MAITLTKEQKDIHDQVIDWFRNNNKLFVCLGGYAGTGKSTLVGFITDTIKKSSYISIAYVAYTGKASLVLRNSIKNLEHDDFVGTIHSLIYKPQVNEHREIIGWSKKASIPFSLIILDEASMVDKDIWNDLLSYGIPILAVGDHGQLPPIGENNFSLMKDPELKLQTIHRQALENPIIKLSMFVRKYGYIPTKIFGKTAAKFNYSHSVARKILDEYDYKSDTQILCGMNKTRVKLNDHVRQLNDFTREEPYPGEKLICLKNNKKQYIMNGQMGILKRASIKTDYLLEIDINMDGNEFSTTCITHRKAFGQVKYNVVGKETYNEKILNGLDYIKKPIVNLFDFGYAISVHKSQGSQFNKVILIEERNSYQNDDNYKRWLYTGITRAAEKIIIISDFY